MNVVQSVDSDNKEEIKLALIMVTTLIVMVNMNVVVIR